ncbi:hypothetical protein GQ53DRAFT_710494 [Thozetella sp. PMI_491]|nr:hypothetical protein GQ53DRAFT_710494 [Thozetella sp. PMI_491]
MASLQQVDEDAIPAKALELLSQTTYACSSISEPLATRPGNYVYRGILSQPLTGQDGVVATSVIIKYSIDLKSTNKEGSTVDAKRCAFEEVLFKAVAEFSPKISDTAVIRAPRIHLYDHERNIQVLEDLTNTTGFKMMLFSSDGDKLIPESSRRNIGRYLGSWLRSFHTWASAPQQATLRGKILSDDPMRKLKLRISYNSFLGVLENYPELLEGHRELLETIRNAKAKEFEKPATDADEDWGLIHGDLWCGNILIPTTGWQEPTAQGKPNELFMIDWEYAQFGHRSYDIGHIVGDLCERIIYNKADTALPVLEGFVEGYGQLSDEMAFRVAIHVGVHAINWHKRRPKKGPWVASPEAIVAGLAVTRDFVIKGWEKDKAFFEGTLLASLFTAK